jgi:hypothetical protein
MVVLSGSIQTAYAGNESTSSVDPVSELQDAALNYEAAAKALLSSANLTLNARYADVSDENPKKVSMKRSRNAAMELQASGQLMGAVGHFNQAVRVWRTAANKTSEKAAQDYFRSIARQLEQHATSLVRQAAELAENAALEYASLNDLGKQAHASAKAGQIREALSSRP